MAVNYQEKASKVRQEISPGRIRSNYYYSNAAEDQSKCEMRQ